MIASLQIEMEQSREERRAGRPPKVSVKGAWISGGKPVAALTALQSLALLEEARMEILAAVPFTPPEEKKIDVVSEKTLDQIKKKLVVA